eukprot:6596424-Prymnesium_polylepis.1
MGVSSQPRRRASSNHSPRRATFQDACLRSRQRKSTCPRGAPMENRPGSFGLHDPYRSKRLF